MKAKSILPPLPYTQPVLHFFVQVQADFKTKIEIETECQHIARMIRAQSVNSKMLELAVKNCAERDARYL